MKAYIVCIFFIIFIIRPALGQVEKIRGLQQNLANLRDSTQYVDAINRIALLFYEQNADSTFQYALNAREIATRLQYEKGIADATNNLGIVFDIKGNIQLALRYYNDAYNQYVTLGDSSNIIQTLMNIAMVYTVSGKDQKALANFDRALLLGNASSKDSITSLVIYNYILIYPEKFDVTKKAALIEKARKIAAKYHDTRLEIAIQQLVADDLIATQNPQEGIALLKKTLASALDKQLYYLSMDLLIDVGENHFKENPERAIQYFQQALKIAEEKRYRMYAKEICNKLYHIYLNAKDEPNAFIYSQKLLKIYEEQAEIDRESGIDYIEYAVKDQQLVSERVKSEYNTRLLWLAIAVCALTLLSIIFLWRNWKLSRQTNKVLTLQFRQLESTSEALERTNLNYARLIKMVAHDLRNPIGGILSLSSLLQEENLTADESKEFVELIVESSNNCLRMIGDLLKTDFEFKESELQKEIIDLPSFLQQAITLLTFRANEKNQQLLLDEPVQVMINADRDQLLRVLNNLIVNAIKFSPEGEIIQVNTEQTKEGVVIAVKDNGLGIPDSAVSKLFDPFTTAKRVGTAGEQPVGLGLYISKQIVEAHRGRIWLETREGEGTTFYVLLPAETALVASIATDVPA